MNKLTVQEAKEFSIGVSTAQSPVLFPTCDVAIANEQDRSEFLVDHWVLVPLWYLSTACMKSLRCLTKNITVAIGNLPKWIMAKYSSAIHLTTDYLIAPIALTMPKV